MGDKTIWERGGNNVWTIMCGEGGIAQFGMGKTVWDCGIWMMLWERLARQKHHEVDMIWREYTPGGKSLAGKIWRPQFNREKHGDVNNMAQMAR